LWGVKDEWDAKEDPCKFMKNVLYGGMAKGTSQAEATSNSEKIKPIAFVIVKLHKSEGITQAGS